MKHFFDRIVVPSKKKIWLHFTGVEIFFKSAEASKLMPLLEKNDIISVFQDRNFCSVVYFRVITKWRVSKTAPWIRDSVLKWQFHGLKFTNEMELINSRVVSSGIFTFFFIKKVVFFVARWYGGDRRPDFCIVRVQTLCGMISQKSLRYFVAFISIFNRRSRARSSGRVKKCRSHVRR
jgi:hypothetical protein